MPILVPSSIGCAFVLHQSLFGLSSQENTPHQGGAVGTPRRISVHKNFVD